MLLDYPTSIKNIITGFIDRGPKFKKIPRDCLTEAVYQV